MITKEDVLKKVMSDEAIDAIRLKISDQLKHEVIKSNVFEMMQGSEVLKAPGAEKLTIRELADALRGEHEAALQALAKSVRDSIFDQNGLGKEIDDTVDRVILQLAEPTKEKKIGSPSSSMNRKFETMSTEEAVDTTQESSSELAMPENVAK